MLSVPARSAAFPSLPGLPPGADPTRHRIGEVHALLSEAAFIPMFTAPDPSRISQPIFLGGDPSKLIGVHVREQPHRFALNDAAPSLRRGLRATNVIGEPVALVSLRWMLCPDNFEAAPGREPPPTVFDPRRPQRFVMLEGDFRFLDTARSGFKAFGAGRTIPMLVEGQPRLGLGSVIDVLEGYGELAGLPATNVVVGYIEPPFGLSLFFLFRVVDLQRRLREAGEIRPMRPIASPAAGTSVLAFLGETDPSAPVTLRYDAAGRVLGSNVTERLRAVRLDYDLDSRSALRARLRVGPVVGRLTGTLHFNPFDPLPVTPIYTTGGYWRFFDDCGRTIGSARIDIDEGRAFRTALAGAPTPTYRFGGFGMFHRGEGALAGVNGLVSLNAGVSVFPRTLSNLYVLRINDPHGRFLAPPGQGWL